MNATKSISTICTLAALLCGPLASAQTDIGWCSRQVVSGGVNFFLGGVHAYM